MILKSLLKPFPLPQRRNRDDRREEAGGVAMSHKNNFDSIVKRIKPSADCWEWQGGLNSAGYGITMINNRHWLVHRFIWTHWFGEIPKGLLICHRCDNRKCANKTHLFLGTNQDNMKDAGAKGRVGIQRHPERYINRIRRLDGTFA